MSIKYTREKDFNEISKLKEKGELYYYNDHNGYIELDNSPKSCIYTGRKYYKHNPDYSEGFDFREDYKSNLDIVELKLFRDFNNIFNTELEKPIKGILYLHPTLARAQCEIVIREHFKRIVGDWVPDWDDDTEIKNSLTYDNISKNMGLLTTIDYQDHPDWFYFPANKEKEIIKEVKRMKKLYGKDFIKYYLTGRE